MIYILPVYQSLVYRYTVGKSGSYSMKSTSRVENIPEDALCNHYPWQKVSKSRLAYLMHHNFYIFHTPSITLTVALPIPHKFDKLLQLSPIHLSQHSVRMMKWRVQKQAVSWGFRNWWVMIEETGELRVQPPAPVNVISGSIYCNSITLVSVLEHLQQ